MINIVCPVCKTPSTQSNSIYQIQKNQITYQIRSCGNCHHIYTYFSQNVDIQEYYDDKDYKVRDTQKTIFYRIQESEYKGVVKKIKSFLNEANPSLLDFGSGKGLFLNFAKQEGFMVKGIETSKPRANYAKEFFDLEIDTKEYVSGKIFENTVDVITLFHVLEHIDDPVKLLSNLVNENLNEQGILIIEVPNFKSWQSKWSGKHWLHLDVPRHINHFYPAELIQVLNDLGFTIKNRENFSLHLGVIGMTQCIWNIFGYQGFLIRDLKEKKSLPLLLKIAFTLPFAFVLECMASVFNKGGVMRFYAQKQI